MEYRSQFGQDSYLWDTYFSKRASVPGVFVDIGAHDGVTGNNTLFFEKLGWQGICFEPVPAIFERLKANRTCQLRCIALADKIGTSEFLFIKGYSEMLSGLADQYSQDHISRIHREMAEHEQEHEMIQVNTSTFGREVPFRHIDYLSLDVEGAEEMILRSIPFQQYEIDFMTVEFNDPSDNRLHEYILSQGYTFVRSLGCDRLFKRV